MEGCDVSHWAESCAGIIADHSVQGILVVDGALRVTRANDRAAAILGAHAARDLVGLAIQGDGSTTGIWFDKPLFESGDATVEPARCTVASEFGAEFPAEVLVLAVPLADSGDDTGHLLLINDLSVQVDLERTVLQSEKLEAMENIVAGIAHELNNPMTAILGYAELLLATEKDPRRKQRVALIAEEADRCGKIIASMLTYTRSYGKTLESASINTVLDEVLTLQSYQLRVDKITLHRFLDETIPNGPLLTAGLRRLFLNLIHNAHQALLEVPAQKRNLWAMTELRGKSIYVQIADDGPGIPPAIRHKIFDPFFTTRPLGEGMGLGLSVAFGVVHEHGGKIWAEQRTGGGAAVCFEIPIRT